MRSLLFAGRIVVVATFLGAPAASFADGARGLAAPAESALAKRTAALPAVPCTCRFEGGDYELGETICIRGRQATCDRVLNNTSWSFSERSCLFTSGIERRTSGG